MVKHYFKFEEELFTEAKKQAAKNQEVKPPTELSAAVMSGKYLTPAEVSLPPARRSFAWAHGNWSGLRAANKRAPCKRSVSRLDRSSRSARTCRPRHNYTQPLPGWRSSQHKCLPRASRWCPPSWQSLSRRSLSWMRTRARLWARLQRHEPNSDMQLQQPARTAWQQPQHSAWGGLVSSSLAQLQRPQPP